MLLVAALSFGCGKSKYEEAMEEMVDVFEEMADIMATIEDEASAKAAEKKMNALAARMQNLSAMEPPPPEVAMELQKKYEPKLQEVGERFMKEAFRLMMLDGMDEETLQNMMAHMDK